MWKDDDSSKNSMNCKTGGATLCQTTVPFLNVLPVQHLGDFSVTSSQWILVFAKP